MGETATLRLDLGLFRNAVANLPTPNDPHIDRRLLVDPALLQDRDGIAGSPDGGNPLLRFHARMGCFAGNLYIDKHVGGSTDDDGVHALHINQEPHLRLE